MDRKKQGRVPDPDPNKPGRDVPSANDLEKWEPVWGGIDPELPDAEKLDILLARFRANPVGFQYNGPARTWSLRGDCGSLARTFQALAETALGVEGVTIVIGERAGGWYVPPGFREIDPTRAPTVANGGYYYSAAHVWARWGGTDYDVLFGVTGIHGRPVDDRSTDQHNGMEVSVFKADDTWFRMGPDQVVWVPTRIPPNRSQPARRASSGPPVGLTDLDVFDPTDYL
jgi:hypothetical protein